MFVRPEIASRVAQQSGLRRILLPLNGAPSTMAVVGMAIQLAEQSAAELDVLCVAALRARGAEERGTFAVPRYVDQPQYEWPAWMQEYIALLYARAGEHFDTASIRVFVRHGEPATEILRFAAEQNADLIVLEWQGHWDSRHSPVVQEVLLQSACPVMMLRAAPLDAERGAQARRL